MAQTRIRLPGAGRQHLLDTRDGLDAAFCEVVDTHTAGSPVNASVRWTYLNRRQIAEKLSERGYPVSVTVVDQLLARHDVRRRKAQKRESCGSCADRNAHTNSEAIPAYSASESGNTSGVRKCKRTRLITSGDGWGRRLCRVRP
jgi:hypothetical protein